MAPVVTPSSSSHLTDAGDFTLEELLAEVDPENLQLLNQLRDVNSELARRLQVGVGSIQQDLRQSRKDAIEAGVASNVATDNLIPLWRILRTMKGFHITHKAFREVGFTTEQIRLARTPKKYVSLEFANRFAITYFRTLGLASGFLLAAAYMVDHGFGPIDFLMRAAQETFPNEQLYKDAPKVSGKFNRVKKMELVYSDARQCLMNSTVVEGIRPMEDYIWRFFVWPIVAGATIPKALVYLKRYAGVDRRAIIKEYFAAHKGLPRELCLKPTGMNEGMYAWWRKEHSTKANLLKLPQRLSANLKERGLQFPLLEALRTHIEWAKEANIYFPLEDVHENGPFLYGRYDGVSVRIARRVKLNRDLVAKGRIDWRELEPGEAWQGEPYLVETTIHWCDSPELNTSVNVCETSDENIDKGQLWDLPFSQWHISWENPEIPLWVQGLHLGKLVLKGMKGFKNAVKEFLASQAAAEQVATQTVDAYKRELDHVQQTSNEIMGRLLRAAIAGKTAMADFRSTLEREFRAKLRKSQYGHIECVTDLSTLLLVREAGYGLNDLWALTTTDPDPALLSRELTDEKFRRTRDAIKLIRIAAFLHDIGKLIVPDRILSAAGKQPPKHQALIRAHVTFGEIIGYALYYDDYPRAVITAFEHHEEPNGNGYPHKKKGYQLGFLSRIIAGADKYHAMRGERPEYRDPPSMPRLLVFQIMEGNANNNAVDPWQVNQLMALAIWMRDELSRLPAETLREYGLSDEMVDFIIRIEGGYQVTNDAEDVIFQRVAANYPENDPLIVPPWDEQEAT